MNHTYKFRKNISTQKSLKNLLSTLSNSLSRAVSCPVIPSLPSSHQRTSLYLLSAVKRQNRGMTRHGGQTLSLSFSLSFTLPAAPSREIDLIERSEEVLSHATSLSRSRSLTPTHTSELLTSRSADRHSLVALIHGNMCIYMRACIHVYRDEEGKQGRSAQRRFAYRRVTHPVIANIDALPLSWVLMGWVYAGGNQERKRKRGGREKE